MYLCRRILDKLPFRNASASSLDTVLVLCRRFHLFAMQLGRRHGGRDAVSIQDEYDVQDHRQFPGLSVIGDPLRYLGPVQRDPVEEPERAKPSD